MGRRASQRVTCFLCGDEVEDGNYVLWVLHNGLLKEVCGVCLDKYCEEERE
jgi:hypothetical protein